MLTPEQVENWRNVLFGMVGPYAFLMSVDEIEKFKDILQKKVDDAVYEWQIKIKMDPNPSISWDSIKEEPTRPVYSIEKMTMRCKDLLIKYPKIVAVQFSDANAPSLSYVVKKNPDGSIIFIPYE
jgi:hypothetical protein